jgi:hypothetical protein
LTEILFADISCVPKSARSRIAASPFLREKTGLQRMEAFLILGLILSAAGLAQAGLMLVHAWEHHRYHRRRWASPLKPDVGLRTALIAPCKGLDPDLRSNLRALFELTYSQYELCFVVEAEEDPAAAVIRELIAEHPHIPSRLVIAEAAQGCGQKVHNLTCAARSVLNDSARLPEPDVLAFVDSDAAPDPGWLARLVERLVGGKQAIATGYRWYVPMNGGWPSRLLSAINNTVIAVMGPHGFNLVWGGSWAVRTATFRALGLPGAWKGALSDDLVVSRLAREAKLRVAYEPHCLVRSKADINWAGLFEFLKRQYTIVRICAPLWWQFAFWMGLFVNGVCLGMLFLACASLFAGGPWLLLVAPGAGYYLAGVLRMRWATTAVRPFVAVSDAQYDRVARLNIWGWPLVAMVGWLGVVSGALGRTVMWRGIRYRLDSAWQTTILNHPAGLYRRHADARTATRAA